MDEDTRIEDVVFGLDNDSLEEQFQSAFKMVIDRWELEKLVVMAKRRMQRYPIAVATYDVDQAASLSLCSRLTSFLMEAAA